MVYLYKKYNQRLTMLDGYDAAAAATEGAIGVDCVAHLCKCVVCLCVLCAFVQKTNL